jgi:hypothetical protein
LAQDITGDHLAGLREQSAQRFEGLVLQANQASSSAQFAGVQVHVELTKRDKSSGHAGWENPGPLHSIPGKATR